MADRFTWRGIPVKDEQGNTVAVIPVRGIVAPDGKTYPGVLDQDADGNAFTWNQVPNDYSPTPIVRKTFMTADGIPLVTADGNTFKVRGNGA